MDLHVYMQVFPLWKTVFYRVLEHARIERFCDGEGNADRVSLRKVNRHNTQTPI
jgi:hypothetical protein